VKRQLIKSISGIVLFIVLFGLPFFPTVKNYLTIPTEVNLYTNSTETFQLTDSAHSFNLIDQSEQDIIKLNNSSVERLLEKTGGIVQGMSGSPIIQDNKIVGAVTHVFVNDPTSGYGIHIEWMLEEAEINYKETFAQAG